ncbi:hypothetical protein JCM11251_007937 [Rhodosporidiobolus azoricus]
MYERSRRPPKLTRRNTVRQGQADDTAAASAEPGPLPASTSAFDVGAHDHRQPQLGKVRYRMDEADSANLSPWTGLGSPSSSDFETISDSEVRHVDLTSASSSSHRARQDSASSMSNSSRGRGTSSSRSAAFGGDDSDANRRGIEGDDEDSSAFEDAGGYAGGYGDDERGRGRGRTRRREPGPEMRRSMLEDALRSSLATLLSLAPGQPSAMSQTPSMSHASLAALWSPTSTAPPTAPAVIRPSQQRVSPFASALEHEDEDEEDDLEHVDRPTLSSGEDVFLSSSSSSSSSSSEDGTQLGLVGGPFTRSTPAPLPINITTHPSSSSAPQSQSRSRTRSYSHPESDYIAAPPSSSLGLGLGNAGEANSANSSSYSPLHPSRPLLAGGLPSSNSPPTFSRSRHTRDPHTRGTGWSHGTRKRGGRGGGGTRRGGSTSPAPMPASVEERRRARAEAAAAAAAGWGSQSVGEGVRRGGGERRGTGTGTDVEGDGVERDEAFAELLCAARFFSDLSPRSSRTALPSLPLPLSSLPSYYASASASSATQPLFGSGSNALQMSTASGGGRREDGERDEEEEEEDEEDEEEDDPALASESVPTLGGLSSGDSSRRSRSTSSAAEVAKSPDTEFGPKEEKALDQPNEKQPEEEGGKKRTGGGVLGWLRGLGSAVVELKVWHLVGICGLLIGVGLGAGSLISSLASSTPLLSFLHLHPPSSSFGPVPTSGSLIKVPPRLARFGTSAPRGEEGGMSALFS